MKRCIAKKVYSLTHDAPSDEAFIAAADVTSRKRTGEGLDSWDIGDAMGAFADAADAEPNGTLCYAFRDFTITVEVDWELFDWGPKGEPPTLMNFLIGTDYVQSLLEKWDDEKGDDDE